MKTRTRGLVTTLVAAGCMLAFTQVSHASAGPHSWEQGQPWAPANPNGTPFYPVNLGAFGQWQVSGGIDGVAGIWNNSQLQGSHANTGITIPNAEFIVNGHMSPWYSLRAWAGLPPLTPVVGYPNSQTPALNTVNGFYIGGTAHASPFFKGYIKIHPPSTPWFSLWVGRIDSTDGTEIGVGWFNPTPELSDLNNMQTTTADGVQGNFSWGPWALSVRYADGYYTHTINELGFLGQYSIPGTPDWIIGFGHTRLGTAQCIGCQNHVASFGVYNADLIGFGAYFQFGNQYAVSPEVQYQWLPKNISPGHGDQTVGALGTIGSLGCTNSAGTAVVCEGPSTTYSEWAVMVDFTDQINDYWQLAIQPMYVHQHGVSPTSQDATTYMGGESLANIYGNFLGLGAPVAPGASIFGQGNNLFGLQVGGTWMYKNLFVRPFLVFAHQQLNEAGSGYGVNGNKSNQITGLIEIGWLLGDAKQQ